MTAEKRVQQDGRITLRELEQLLRRWGFRRERGSETLVFRHGGSDTLIVLPPYRSHDSVAATHLVTIRKLVTERGIVAADAFDRQTVSAVAG